MAEFPYPEYRNLWTGSAPSKDLSAFTGGWRGLTLSQISDGLRLTLNEDVTPATSLIDSTYEARVPITPGYYTWQVTFRNSGATPTYVSFGSRWFSSTGSQLGTSSIPLTLMAPGEVQTFSVSRNASDDMVLTGLDRKSVV